MSDQFFEYAQRSEIIKRARAIKNEIDQIFTDANYWNKYRRKPDEAPIDPDPTGELKRMLIAINRMLNKEQTP